jgi:hypothetical protein
MVKRKINADIIVIFPGEEPDNFKDEKLLELEMKLNAIGDLQLGDCKARFHFKEATYAVVKQ